MRSVELPKFGLPFLKAINTPWLAQGSGHPNLFIGP